MGVRLYGATFTPQCMLTPFYLTGIAKSQMEAVAV